MQGTIAQAVALVVEGNAVLRGVSSHGLGSDHSTMTFCEYVHFADVAQTPTGWSERIVAADPAAWFRYLSERGFNELRLSHGPSRGTNPNGVPDRMLAALIGGGAMADSGEQATRLRLLGIALDSGRPGACGPADMAGDVRTSGEEPAAKCR